jgi:hypothetical protein
MEGDADRQGRYVNEVQNAVEGALHAARHLDDPHYYCQKQILIMELARAKAYASQLNSGLANDAGPISAEPQIGDKMPAGHPNAGWIYAGISKTTQQPFYVAPKGSGVFKWKEAMAFAAKDESRLPSKEELDQLYTVKDKGALKGIFNVTSSYSAGWYWSSSDNGSRHAWAQRFRDGHQDYGHKDDVSSLRCVR